MLKDKFMPRQSKLDVVSTTKCLNVKISNEAHKRVKVYAAANCTDMNVVIEQLILEHIPKVRSK